MESDVRPLKRLRTSEDEFENYDVFISHRGPDTKIGFAGFLHDGFKSVGLRSFLDFESIGMGQGSWACIERAIKSSPIVVVIFSKNYAQSKWCMKELHLTMEIPNIKVLPVFYKVEPWEVRNPEEGQLKDGFAKLKDRVAKSKDGQSASCIANWKEALERVSELRGVKCKDGDQRLEKDIVKEIVEQVSEWANKLLPLNVGEHVVGVDTTAQEIIQRLDQEKSVKLLGLWGMGGIGKSTLARELYNCLRTRFGARSFIEDVSDKLGISGGVAKVQSRILKDLCKDCNGVEDKSSGKVVLEKRLCEKKILLVLDDVHESDDMEHLVSREILGDGSLCIVTSRDKRLFEACSFVSNQVYIHDVQGLGNEASKQVFTSYAFGGGFRVKKELEELVLCITTACGGVPLVLKVCGALLKNENDIAIWKDVLKQLQCGSIVEEKKIFECLRISYDALQAQQKDMFLDIACALLGQSKDYAIKIWMFKRWRAASGIRNLVKKALVIVGEDGCFCMHDLIRDMGRTIVQMERTREGIIRRLWEPESSKYLMGAETWPKSLQTLVIIYPLNDKVGDSSVQLDLSTLKDLYVLRCILNPMTTLSIPKNLLWFSCIGKPYIHLNRFSVLQSSELMILDLGQHSCKTMYESLKDASELEVVGLSQITRLHWLPSSLRDLKVWQASWSKTEGLLDYFIKLSL